MIQKKTFAFSRGRKVEGMLIQNLGAIGRETNSVESLIFESAMYMPKLNACSKSKFNTPQWGDVSSLLRGLSCQVSRMLGDVVIPLF